MTIRAVVFDLDGVVRHFSPTVAVEAHFGLPAGALYDAAFEPHLIDPTVTGARHYDEWIAMLGDELARRHGEHTRGAAHAFSQLVATVDDAVLDLIRRLRANGYVVAILTNGTTRVEQEVADLQIDREVDHLFNSARIGVAKPEAPAYEHVLSVLGIRPDECVFIDDSPAKCDGARTVGMHVIDYVGITELEAELQTLGVRS